MAIDDPPKPLSRVGRAALWYATERGWRVFPLHSVRRDKACTCGKADCGGPGKHPRTAKGCLDATTDPAQIRAWWTRWPGANIGIATGQGLVVVDVDPRHGGDDSLVDLRQRHGDLPDTVEALTASGGRHLYLHTEDPIRNSAGLLGSGLDVRGEGGYVVAPPSVGVLGGYDWEATSRPEAVSVAPIPAAWLAAVTSRPRLRVVPGTKGEPFPEGERNDSLYRRACSMRSIGLARDAILAAISHENETRCVPALDPAEVKAIVESACKHPEGYSAEVKAKLEARKPKAATQAPEGDRTEANDPDAEAPDVPESEIFDRGDSIEIAERLLRDLRGASAHPIVYDRSELWRYDNDRGIFVLLERSTVYAAVGKYAGVPRRTKEGLQGLALADGAIKGAINAAQNLAARPGFFNDAPCGICFVNGWVTVRDGGKVDQQPHSPEHRAQHTLPVEYDPDAGRRRWIDMLLEVFRRESLDDDGKVTGHDHEEAERAIDLLQEFAGASLLGQAVKHAVCLVLSGSGNDGKSRVLSVLRSLFPPDAVCSVSPNLWGRGFLLAELAGKRLNVVSELPGGEMQDSERFKQVVAGDPVTAERKHRDPFTLESEAGNIFACNDLPGTRDQSRGFWRRFAVIPCTRSFEASEEVKDIDKIVIAAELAGIAAWAIEGARRLMERGHYLMPKASEQAKSDWQQASDQVRQWVDVDCKVLGRDSTRETETGLAGLYAVYRRWAADNGHPPLASSKFGARLKSLGLEHRYKDERLFRLEMKDKPVTPAAPRSGGKAHG